MAELRKIIIADAARNNNNKEVSAALRSPSCRLLHEFMEKFERPCCLFVDQQAPYVTLNFKPFDSIDRNRQVIAFIKEYFAKINIFPLVEVWETSLFLAEKLFQPGSGNSEKSASSLIPANLIGKHPSSEKTTENIGPTETAVSCKKETEELMKNESNEKGANTTTAVLLTKNSGEPKNELDKSNKKTTESESAETESSLYDGITLDEDLATKVSADELNENENPIQNKDMFLKDVSQF
jgi:hypothetical protein